jgi:hypothetical protein
VEQSWEKSLRLPMPASQGGYAIGKQMSAGGDCRSPAVHEPLQLIQALGALAKMRLDCFAGEASHEVPEAGFRDKMIAAITGQKDGPYRSQYFQSFQTLTYRTGAQAQSADDFVESDRLRRDKEQTVNGPERFGCSKHLAKAHEYADDLHLDRIEPGHCVPFSHVTYFHRFRILQKNLKKPSKKT